MRTSKANLDDDVIDPYGFDLVIDLPPPKTGRRQRVNASIDPDEDVELGAHVEARVRGVAGGSVVAVRVPRDLLAQMNEYGRLRGMTVIDVLLQGAERVIGGTADQQTQHE